MKNQAQQTYVEIKTVTWSKDSHGLFDYESKNVNYTKSKIENSSKIYKDGGDISVKSYKENELIIGKDKLPKEPNFLFSIMGDSDKNDKFSIKIDDTTYKNEEDAKNNALFLIVRSLKNEDGTQKGYNLEVGDIIRLGRIEYRVIEYKTQTQIFSLYNTQQSTIGSSSSSSSIKPPQCPFELITKEVLQSAPGEKKRECRICFMDENDSNEVLVNPCNCKGTSEYVHVKCIQDWINSKVKRKANHDVSSLNWKKLNCEVCKLPLPDIVEVNSQKRELIPIERPDTPYILLERVFYDKTKENGDHNKNLILLGLLKDTNQIKLGRGHECDLRENDISVSRLHAYIKFANGIFTIVDNNSKFGTLVLLRKSIGIEKKKIALQIGRTVLTFSLKQCSINNIPVFKPMLMEKLYKMQSPKNIQIKPSMAAASTKHKNLILPQEPEKQDMNGSFLD
jgi:hypothetical protein